MAAEKITGTDENINAAEASIPTGQHHLNIEVLAASQQLVPTGDGVERRRHLQLFHAALSGDWEAAEDLYDFFPGEVNARITNGGETALHIAAAAEHTHFVKKLVKRMSAEALTYKNEAGDTSFCFAAISGVEALAKVMMKTGHDLAMTRGRENLLPIYMAALLGHRGMVSYLYEETKERLTDSDRITLLVALINSDIFDLALKLLKAHPRLAYARDEHELTALHALAQKSCMPSSVVDRSPPGFWNKFHIPFSGLKLAQMRKVVHKQALDLIWYLWEQVILLDDETISCQIGKPWPLIFTAAERGNLDFLTILILLYPDLIFKVEHNMYTIFHIAILNRQEHVFRIIYEIGSIKNLIATYHDYEGNNMLHLAAKVLEPPSRLHVIPGAALQLQRDLLWFEEVKKVVQPQYIEEKNTDGKTPGALFIEQHKEMMKEGEQWMRYTADSCMLVATLIATVVFTAAFTLPGVSGFKLAQMKKVVHKQALDLIRYLWEQVILLDDETISCQIGKPWPLIFTAAERGNLDFLTILIRLYPDLIFKVDQNTYSIFHIAILNRHEDIFKMIYQIGSIKNVITIYKDGEGNNMLHLAARVLQSPSRLNVIPGAALQLQHELLWFEEVKKVVQPRHIEEKNIHGKTPGALFIEQHKEMMKEGEQWMRDTADSCMLVATLIATVVFAAAFTVPGGNMQDEGTPVFVAKIEFKIFAISDAISLVASTSSLLTFLSIRTSRYAERDFLWSLPNRLIIGLTTLFISIGAMMVAFMATFFLVFRKKLHHFSIPVAVVASLPVIFFIWQHYRLFLDMIDSTYTSRSLFKPGKSPLFSKRVKPKVA